METTQIDQDPQINFLARRQRGTKRLGDERRTIDIRRDLMYPLELLERKQIVNFSLESVRRECKVGVKDKYRPIPTKDRYQL